MERSCKLQEEEESDDSRRTLLLEVLAAKGGGISGEWEDDGRGRREGETESIYGGKQ